MKLESQALAPSTHLLCPKVMDAKISSWNSQFRASNTNRESCKLFAFNLNTNSKYVHADFQIYMANVHCTCTIALFIFYICWHKTYSHGDIAAPAAAAAVAVDDDIYCKCVSTHCVSVQFIIGDINLRLIWFVSCPITSRTLSAIIFDACFSSCEMDENTIRKWELKRYNKKNAFTTIISMTQIFWMKNTVPSNDGYWADLQ